MKTTLLRNGSYPDDFGLSSKKWNSSCRGKLGLTLLLMLYGLFFSNTSSAQIALRETRTSTSTTTTVTIVKPVGLTAGDVMLAQIMQSGNDGSAFTDATSSGWIFVAGSNMNPSGNNRYRATILYKIATATDVAAANFAFALDGDSDDGQGAISAFSGVDIAGGVTETGAVGGPFDVDPGNAYNNIASDGQLNANGITTGSANAAIIFFGMMANDTNGGGISATNPSSWSELYDEDFDNSGQDSGIISSWGTRTTAGATGNASSNLGTSTTNGALLIALKRFTGTITTGTVTGPICAGSAVSVPYTISGSYATGNVFTAQLSNASGSFTSPTTIGTATSTAAGSISATIPGGQAAGTGYRIRVISNFPPATGSDNGTNLSIVAPATASAGSAFNACATATNIAITTGATATNNGGILWTSNGTGTINNPTSLSTATYTPGIGEASTVTFTLTATGNSPCGNATSNKVMTLVQAPTASAGGSATICSNQTHVVSGASASNGTISWTENGTGSITANGTTAAPTYTPGAGENATVTLTMTVTNATCGSVQATYTINVVAAATAVAGSAFNACATATNIPITTGASAANGTVLWTSNGTGTINNPTSINSATYTPGVGEASTVTFTLTTTANAPCSNPSSNKVMTLVQPPTANAGGSASICSNQTHVVSGATASNGTISWTENGTGSITANGTTVAPTYTPGVGENATVTLTMTVTNATCGSTQATYTINVTAAPLASAGTTIVMCTNAGATNITAGATATNNAGITWTSNGTGTIADANSLTLATYTPGPGETGSVTLTLTASGNGPCANAVSNKTLTINPIPVAAGVVQCQGQPSMPMTSPTICISAAPVTSAATFPTAAVNSGTGTAWANTANIYSNNSVNTTVQGATGAIVSQTLNTTGYGFAIPANATITGFQMSIARNRSGTALAGEVQDNSLRLLKAGSAVGTNKGATSTNWPTTKTVANYGGTGDLWGTTWTAAEVNASNFGAAIVVDISAGFVGSRVANVDYISIAVTYTVPGDLTWYTVSSGGSSIGTGSSFNPVGVAGSGLADTNTAGTTTYYVECSTIAGCRTPVDYVINPLPSVSFTGLGASYCGSPSVAVTLTGNHAPAGTFTGAGITDNANGTATFDPSVAGAGSHNIIYSYTDGNTCTNTETQSVTVIAPTTYYADADGDGFGNPAVTELSCAGPSVGFVANNTDCNDAQLNYLDADGDGFGSTTFVNCGGVLNNTDCDDAVLNYSDVDGDGFGSDTFVNCGGVLNTDDCDDNAIQYLDADGDGFGSTTQVACGVTNNTDCDDAVLNYADVDGDGFGSDTFVNCGGVLNTDDCNDNLLLYSDVDGDGFGSDTLVACGGVANTDDCDDNAIQYLDNDGDGFGSTTPVACGVLNNTDCNDNDNTMNTTFSFYVDADGDTYGTGSLVSACAVDALTAPAGYSSNNTDCDDANINIYQSGSLYVDGDGDGFSNGSTAIVCYGATAPTGYVLLPTAIDCNDAVFAINPGHAEVLYNGVDDDCDTLLDEGNLLTTSLLPASCGTTLTSIGSLIGITTVGGHPITGYRVRATNGAQVQTIEIGVPHFTMPAFASHAYATTYTIEIELQRAGIWLGYYGAPCQVSTPAVLAEGGASSVNPSQCGITLNKINTLIATTSLQGVTGYRFRITNLTDQFGPNAVQTLDRSQNWFSLQMLARYNYGTLYRIEVAVKTTGDYGGFGSPCEINSPSVPTLVNCGGTAAAGTTTIAATSLSGATQYRFQIIRQSDNATATIDRNSNYFTFNMVPAAAFTAGSLYSVRVAVMTTGTWSPFGDACEITSPGTAPLAKGIATDSVVSNAQAADFKVAAYPNPFTADFNIDVTTSSQENVELKVYDMLGKLIESKQVNAADLNMEKVGAQYPSGVYNVIVSQDGIVKTLRVIKR